MNTFDYLEEKLTSINFVIYMNRITHYKEEYIIKKINTSIEEAKYTWNYISTYLKKDMRILEIGSGIGILAIYLYINNYNVYALEPASTGFEENKIFSECIREYLKIEYILWDFKIIDLKTENHGVFDFIFSNNVLEHVDDLENSLISLNNILSPNGKMLHMCPNYFIPYEPHYGIILIPFFSKYTKLFLPKKIKNDGCWKSLNFITYKNIKKLSKKLHASLSFEKSIMYKSFLRLQHDKQFINRHPFLYLITKKIIAKLNLIILIKKIPYQFSTPMVFFWRCK